MKISRSRTSWSLLRTLRRSVLGASSLAILSALTVPGANREAGATPVVPDNAFPACIQFSPVPAGKGWKGEKPPVSAEVQQDTLRNLIEHGFSVLYYPVGGLSDTEREEYSSLIKELAVLKQAPSEQPGVI